MHTHMHIIALVRNKGQPPLHMGETKHRTRRSQMKNISRDTRDMNIPGSTHKHRLGVQRVHPSVEEAETNCLFHITDIARCLRLFPQGCAYGIYLSRLSNMTVL